MDKYAIIGNPVKMSLSPKIHAAFAKQVGISVEYHAIEAPRDGFKQTILWFKDHGGKGCNVTAPFKSEAFALATKIGDNAKIALAANCLAFLENGNIFADNFDGIGLVEDLIQDKDFNITHKKILIIGAGGATQGILAPLLEKAPHEILIANRTGEKAIDLAQRFQAFGSVSGIALHDLSESDFDLIIHATSMGHHQQLPLLPNGLIKPTTLCYDLSYGPAAKTFLKWALEQGAKSVCDGLGMLVEQAAASFYLWHGVYPQTQPVLAQLQASS
ncbi:MAG: shikimate dehydrogenase [Coxiella sp. RIFCSPHIGHO2_12_FULL_42_15]|nr:MAG: shikimate dehydrogenase [Coxiella sp. RIFCSPHIGHO2_12_FULL_42_15]